MGLEDRDLGELHDEVGEDEDAWLRHWDPGRWLVQRVTAAAQADCEWLLALAEFDDGEGWADSGLFSLVEWLMDRMSMGRATAYEKKQVCHQLAARTPLLEAYGQGEISYSALRACCRVDRPDAAVDEAFVAVAKAGSVADVESAVRTYRLHHEQETPPSEPSSGRRLRVVPWLEDKTKFELIVDNPEAGEILAALQGFLDQDNPGGAVSGIVAGSEVPSSAAADDSGAPAPAASAGAGPGESATADSSRGPGEQTEPQRSFATTRADAFMEMVRAAHANLTGTQGSGADRYMLHLVGRDGQVTFPDGRPVHPHRAAAIACDCSIVRHTVGEDGEELDLGRRSRTWNTAQRRAVLVRDGGTCRFPGCQRHRVDVHHQLPWDCGGHTTISNAISLCPRHHTLLHGVFNVEGDPGGELRFFNGSVHVGSSSPAQAHLLNLQVPA
jgi:hypothetical protein